MSEGIKINNILVDEELSQVNGGATFVKVCPYGLIKVEFSIRRCHECNYFKDLGYRGSGIQEAECAFEW